MIGLSIAFVGIKGYPDLAMFEGSQPPGFE